MIVTAEMWRVFAAPFFGIFVARRVRDGFRLPHCMGCCRAILCVTRLCCGCHAVEIFDVVEVPLEGGGGDPPARVITDRFTRPFEFAVPSLYFHELTANIAEYIQAAAVLHTFKVLSSAPLNSAVDRSVSLKDSGEDPFNLFHGWSRFFHFSRIDTPTPSLCVLFLQWGEWVMTNLERQWLFLFQLPEIGQRQLMRQPFLRVSDTNSVAEKICMGVHGATSALYSVLVPVEWNDLVLLVISRVCHDTTLRRARVVNGSAIFWVPLSFSVV
ncbi:hypothetical protein ECC02_010765 [Trypanosoma cruzi]|uniref:Uncharacterized protein n=1 Tax=Trypanosoma cruzi TaxID=5693 RepID=A0A7J6XQJ9_TRYCR|nr:hypothetical protein ECC02_010765 [Trypanosoma cruzi]